jgi:hypothetical protein
MEGVNPMAGERTASIARARSVFDDGTFVARLADLVGPDEYGLGALFRDGLGLMAGVFWVLGEA